MNSCTVLGPNSTQCHVAPFSPLATGVLAFLSAVVSLITLGGNILVVIAFVVERNLRTATNYFIASLALTDLLIGALSMNLFTLYLLLGRWPLGQLFCDVWLSLDYTACLISQYTVLLITVDRFCSVTMPARYRNWRSEGKIRLMVALSWFLPCCIFFTIINAWPYFTNKGKRLREEGTCYAEFTRFPIFNLVLTLSYYWLTLVVMCSLYAGIYRVALSLQRKSDEKQRRMTNIVSMAGKEISRISMGVTVKEVTQSKASMSGADSKDDEEGRSSVRGATENVPMLVAEGSSSSGCYTRSDAPPANLATAQQLEVPGRTAQGPAEQLEVPGRTNQVPAEPSSGSNDSGCCMVPSGGPTFRFMDQESVQLGCSADNARLLNDGATQPVPPANCELTALTEETEGDNKPRVTITTELALPHSRSSRQPSDASSIFGSQRQQDDEDEDDDDDDEDSLGKRRSRKSTASSETFHEMRKRFGPLNSRFIRGFSGVKTPTPATSRKDSGKSRGGTVSSRKSRTENRARKALRTITLILGAFVICWTPFHILSLIDSFCSDGQVSCINSHLFNLAYWMCYLNSPINPFCYALANNQFKKAFIRILHFDLHRT